MNTTKQPMTPHDCDLRDFQFMPLDVRRLLTSETWVTGNADEKCAAMNLWLESWHQVPAASIPNNDKMLAHLSGSGSKWPKVKEHVLRGWCDGGDGRLYHHVVAEKALEAWEKKKSFLSKIDRRLHIASAEWSALRNLVFSRDNYTCCYCGNRGVKLECDHVIPVSKGGGHSPVNLVTACKKCNRSKGGKTLGEWKK